jgi:hypothetical protein
MCCCLFCCLLWCDKVLRVEPSACRTHTSQVCLIILWLSLLFILFTHLLLFIVLVLIVAVFFFFFFYLVADITIIHYQICIVLLQYLQRYVMYAPFSYYVDPPLLLSLFSFRLAEDTIYIYRYLSLTRFS